MSSSASVSSLSVPTNIRFLFRRCNASFPNSSPSVLIINRSRCRRLSISASVAERNLEVSWFSPDLNAADDYGGWGIVDEPVPRKMNKGFPPFVLVGIGTLIAASVATFSYFSLSRRGFGFQLSNPLNVLNGNLMPSGHDENIEDASSGNTIVPEATSESVTNAVTDSVTSEANNIERQERKLGRIIIPASVDSTQQEAILMLKKLKIIEDDVKADALCSRREYARWLVRVYSVLERNPKHRIVPSVALSGTIVNAFDDVSVEDPDFWFIQSLAEAGIIYGKLSNKYFSSNVNDAEGQEDVNFFPDRLIPRQDLISWKAQLDYEVVPGITEKISRMNMGFMDMRDISSNAPPALFMDILAGDKSILRKVFGQVKRFQPNKPSTNGQAAVALTSGRIREAILTEISRLEAENLSRLNAMEEIRFELLEREDIRRYWDGRLAQEKSRGSKMEETFLAAVYDLEEEKIIQENSLVAYMKEKAAIDCQKQLLSSLKEEVTEMSERLEREMVKHVEEQRNLQDMLGGLQVQQEAVLDAKSILEAEIEALRMLRSWIEDEARKSQGRAKFLEEVARRWKWDDHQP